MDLLLLQVAAGTSLTKFAVSNCILLPCASFPGALVSEGKGFKADILP